MQVTATAKWVQSTARKARLVARSIEGLPVRDVEHLLKFSPRGVAKDIWKVIASAAANAEHNYKLDIGSLRVVRVQVDGAAKRPRRRAGSRSHVQNMTHRSSHLTAVVSDDLEVSPRRRASAAAAPAKAAPKAKAAAKPKTAPKAAPKSKAAPKAAPKAQAAEAKPKAAPKPKSAPKTKPAAKPESSDAPATDGETE